MTRPRSQPPPLPRRARRRHPRRGQPAGRRAPRGRQEAGRDHHGRDAQRLEHLRPAQPRLRELHAPAEPLRHADPLRPEPEAAAGAGREMDGRAGWAVRHAHASQGRQVPQREGSRRCGRRQELREGGRQGSRFQHASGRCQRRRGHGPRRRDGGHQVQEGLPGGVRPAPGYGDHRAGRHGVPQEPRKRHRPVQVRRVGPGRPYDPRAQHPAYWGQARPGRTASSSRSSATPTPWSPRSSRGSAT